MTISTPDEPIISQAPEQFVIDEKTLWARENLFNVSSIRLINQTDGLVITGNVSKDTAGNLNIVITASQGAV